MSDEPRDSTTAGDPTGDQPDTTQAEATPSTASSPSSPSAPWERPRRWNQDALEATRVDDLLAKLGSDDDTPSGRRRRRKEESDDLQTVSASDLIAALTGAGGAAPDSSAPVGRVSDDEAGDEPSTAHPPAASPPDEQTTVLPPGEIAAGWATAGGSADETVLLPPRIGSGDPAPIRDLGDDPRTDFIPKMVGTTAEQAEAESIRAALRRQSGFEPAAVSSFAAAGADPVARQSGSAPPPVDAGKRLEHSERPPRRHRKWMFAGRAVAATLALVTLLGVGVEWRIKDRTDQGLKAHAVDAINTADTHISTARTAATTYTNSKGVKTTQAAKPVANYAPENILLLGSDTRAGTNGNAGDSNATTSTDVAQSDTLMIAHISGDRQHVTILSIPRDTLIPAPSCKIWSARTGKYSNQNNDISPGLRYHINNAYAVGGPKCTITAVQALTGIGITQMLGIDFSGFQAMVDALGGVRVNVCRPVIDTEIGTVIPTTGPQTIFGFQALQLVRARHVIGDTESDLARIRRQQIVLSAILRQVTAAGTLLNPSKLSNFLQAFTNNTFNANVSVDDLVNLAGSLGSLDPAHVTFYTLPTVPSTQISGALDVDASKAPAIFDDLVNDLPLPGEVTITPAKPRATPAAPAPTIAPSLKITVDPAKVDLEVYNVSGQANVATTAAQKLDAVGFKVGDAQLFKSDAGPQTGTTVLYAPANRAAALTVAAAVPGSTLVVTPGLGSTVRLNLGAAYGGTISAVTVGQEAPTSLATAISTGPSISTAPPSTTGGTSLSSVNAGTSNCV